MEDFDVTPSTFREDRRHQSAQVISDRSRSSVRSPFGLTEYSAPRISVDAALRRTGHAIVTMVGYTGQPRQFEVITHHVRSNGPIDPGRVEDVLFEQGYAHEDERRSDAQRELLAYTTMPIVVISGLAFCWAQDLSALIRGVFPSTRFGYEEGAGGFTDHIKKQIDLRYRQLCAYLEQKGLRWFDDV